MVGCNGFQMESTKELNSEPTHTPSPPSPETVDLETDFCDSLLNSVPEALCKSEEDCGQSNPVVLNTECVTLYDSFNMEKAIMPDLDALDLNCLDLECFLSAQVPLEC